MTTIRQLRNEDYSIYTFVSSLASNLSSSITVVDAFPYNELENDTLQPPTVSIEHVQSLEAAVELGSYGFRRNWVINVFGTTDTQRDEMADAIFQGLDNSIPIYDYSSGLDDENPTLIAYAEIRGRSMEPVRTFDEYARIKYWRMTIRFETLTTKV